jgi:tetratricopeptide (TPR) repeat protein
LTNVLRITQTSANQGNYEFQMTLQMDGEFLQTANASFNFDLSANDQERLRWYFEDYLQYAQDPAQSIATHIEQQLKDWGIELFKRVFNANDQTRNLWADARRNINNTRVEIATGVREATAVPWELICDPTNEQPLVLRARAFLRTYIQATAPPKFKGKTKGPIRILLAICRPGGDEDVPFRSVASRVIKGLCKVTTQEFRLDVLRPPTFEQLGRVLRLANIHGKPYHIVHFDGHGTYIDLKRTGQTETTISNANKIKPSDFKVSNRGYLLFENPSTKENAELIDGSKLGNLLVETNIPILVLNACRSAYAESPKEPIPLEKGKHMDALSRLLAFGSLAQEVANAGVAGVVAMRYVVYAVTAAQFMAELYAGLVEGLTLEEAVSMGRKQLYENPRREIVFGSRELQDWSVPIVYSAGSLALFPRRGKEAKLDIGTIVTKSMPSRGWLDKDLPSSPDTGFFGRDEILQMIDRAFDTHSIVLLYAYAGDGKTATASEFARWYSLTGGTVGPVLFTSFESYLPLPRLLDKIGLIFGASLEKKGIQWHTLKEEDRREVALLVLKHIPTLWIWDNVEPIMGFPPGAESSWSKDEQQDLIKFLRDARNTQAKILLTSRREEKEWLNDLPVKIKLPPMSMLERAELAMALMRKRGNRPIDPYAFVPLLNYTQGNPLTITVLVSQAHRENLSTLEQIEGFVDQLRAGEREIEEDKAILGRSRSLEASLSYGFQHGFTDSERRILALLQFFQGFVNSDVLMLMGQGEQPLEDMRGVSRDDCIGLLERASEVGLLSVFSEGCYYIHPALPWYFHDLFHQYFGGRIDDAENAFLYAISQVGIIYHNQYQAGNRKIVDALSLEEANLLQARQIALRKNNLWAIIGTMQGLDQLYDQTGRRSEWKRLVEEIVPYFMDSNTYKPKSDFDELWSLVIGYKIRLARQSQQLEEALSLQEMLLKCDKFRAEAFLDKIPKNLEVKSLNIVRNYIVSIEALGRIQENMANRKCIDTFMKAFDNYMNFGFRTEAATVASHLGNAFYILSEIRNLDEAERWFKKSLELYETSDYLGRGNCLHSLGRIFTGRFRKAYKERKARIKYNKEAIHFYDQALSILPENAAYSRMYYYRSKGLHFIYAKKYSAASEQFLEAIKINESIGDSYLAADLRFNAALAFFEDGKLPFAIEYAKSSLRYYILCPESSERDKQKINHLYTKILNRIKSERQKNSKG